ncbi:MAG: hypothetical protein DHS20C16_26380 [Phycisphaerae bacterium]|nr:MAG: hypothetical protein DHS20C16_26380 [Phycisphaerae bacterium]
MGRSPFGGTGAMVCLTGAMIALGAIGGCKKDGTADSSTTESESADDVSFGGLISDQPASTNPQAKNSKSDGSESGRAKSSDSNSGGGNASANWEPSSDMVVLIPDIPLSEFEPVIQEQLTKAIDAVEADRKSADAVGFLAMLLDSYNLRDESCELYQSASVLDRSSFRWAYLAGRSLFFEDEGERAVEYLTHACALKPDDIPCHVALINALIKVERLQDAGARAVELLEKNPDHPLVSYLLGSINLKLKAPIFAMEYLKPVFVQFPNLGGVRRDMAATLDMLGQEENADKVRSVNVNNNRIPTIEDPHHEAVLKLAIGTNIENERGAFALMRGDAKGAQSHFAKALEYSPDNVSAIVGLAEAHLRLGDFGKCESILQPLVGERDDSLAGTVLLAKLRIVQRRFDDVEKLIERATALGAKPEHILKLRFGVAAGRRDLPATIAILEEQVKNNPGVADRHFDLANALLFSDRVEDAENEFAKTLELDPRHAGAMEGLAGVYTSQGETDAAKTWSLRAFEGGGTAPQTLLWAGREMLDRGEYQQAAAILSQAYAAYPNVFELGDTLSRVYSMCPEPSVRDWEKAMRIAVKLYGDDEDTMPFAGLHTLAAAHAEADNYEEAARIMEVGVKRASNAEQHNDVLKFSKSKRQYTGRRHLYDEIIVPSEYE